MIADKPPINPAAKGPSPLFPNIFDEKILAVRRERAERRGASFLMQRCVQDLADRLLDINRIFENVIIIGLRPSAEALKNALPVDKISKNIRVNPKLQTIAPQSQDLVINLLQLQNENDPIGTLIQMRQGLKPDGLLICALFGGDTLSELRQAFYKADALFFDGVSPRIAPFADHKQAAQLLSRAGLALPVVDLDRFCVNYKKFETLISDLRDLGETNVMVERDPRYLSRDYVKALKENYKKNDSTGAFETQFEILWLTGWAPDSSQQKPAKRGSATIGLDVALNKIAKQT